MKILWDLVDSPMVHDQWEFEKKKFSMESVDGIGSLRREMILFGRSSQHWDLEIKKKYPPWKEFKTLRFGDKRGRLFWREDSFGRWDWEGFSLTWNYHKTLFGERHIRNVKYWGEDYLGKV